MAYGLGDKTGSQPAGSASVKALQQGLAELARWTGNSSFDPADSSGVVGPSTLRAVAAAVRSAPLDLPRWAKVSLAIVTAVAADPNSPLYSGAKAAVEAAAANLAPVIQTALAALRAAGGGGGGGGTASAKYPSGSVGRWHRSRKVWRIYAPIGVGGVTVDLLGFAGALVAKDGTPPAGTHLVGEEEFLPPGVRDGGLEDAPWFKRWPYLAAIGGGALAVGTGGYFLFRKRSR